MHSGSGKSVSRELEMRIHLGKKILKVSDLPYYTSVCSLDDENKIKSDVNYRFGMYLYFKSTIMITEIIECYCFDD